MVPPEKIINAAIEHKANIIGLSGLITPSLDEMVKLVAELKQQNIKIPVMIGGATTSKAHTAVKIAPQTDNLVVHVKDASRAVTVASKILSADNNSYAEAIAQEYEQLKQQYINRKQRKSYVSLEQARNNKLQFDWDNYQIVYPKTMGCFTIEQQSIAVLQDYIDWTPFFHTWQLPGKYPKIFEHKTMGEQAKSVFNDAQKMLKSIIAEDLFIAKARFGFFYANSDNESIIIYDDKARKQELGRWHTIRQQTEKKNNPNLALADFIAPLTSNKIDVIGGFCVTIDVVDSKLQKIMESADSDYDNIMLKALADRLAESFAEYLHQQVRVKYWGYATEENLDNEDLIRMKYNGIRPAFGYPAIPNHLDKLSLWQLLDIENTIRATLTENLAIQPASAVAGCYLAHPETNYFGVGIMQEDQIQNFCNNYNIDRKQAEKWLSQHINLTN